MTKSSTWDLNITGGISSDDPISSIAAHIRRHAPPQYLPDASADSAPGVRRASQVGSTRETRVPGRMAVQAITVSRTRDERRCAGGVVASRSRATSEWRGL
jgi:hypothetical protein